MNGIWGSSIFTDLLMSPPFALWESRVVSAVETGPRAAVVWERKRAQQK